MVAAQFSDLVVAARMAERVGAVALHRITPVCVSLEPGWSRDHSGPLVRPIKRGGIILARGRAGRGIFFWLIKNGLNICFTEKCI